VLYSFVHYFHQLVYFQTQFAGGIGSATFLLLCAYLGTSTVTAVTFLTLSTAMTGVGIGGYHVNYLDIAPRFAGVIMGISNVIGTLPGLIAPQVAKAIAVEVRWCHALIAHGNTAMLLHTLPVILCWDTNFYNYVRELLTCTEAFVSHKRVGIGGQASTGGLLPIYYE